MRFAVRPLVSAALALASMAAVAAPVTLTGQFMSVEYDDSLLSADFGKVSLVETPVNWSCAAAACALASPLSASIVLSSTNGQAVDVTGQTRSLFARFTVTPTWKALTDPTGQQWGYAQTDLGKWSLGADMAQGLPAGDLQFATAYGSVAVVPLYVPLQPPTESSRNFGLHEAGVVTLASASASSMSLVNVDGAGGPILNDNLPWDFRRPALITMRPARWALPSTDSSCASTACMANAAGTVSVSQYSLTFGVTAIATAVPEVSAAPMMLLGFGGLAWVARRQGRRAA